MPTQPDPNLLDMLLRGVLDNADDCIYAKDLEGRYTFANAQVCRLFGRPLEQIIGRQDAEFFDLTLSDQLRRNDLQVLTSGERVESEEANIVLATGEHRVFWTVKSPLRGPDGSIIGMSGISTDITERKRLEGKYEEQRRLLDLVLDNVDAYIYVKDKNGRYVYVNRHVAELYGLNPDKIIGRTDHDVLAADVACRLREADLKLFQTSRKQAMEEILLDPAGCARCFWSVKVPVSLDGHPEALIGFSTDITERKEREDHERFSNTILELVSSASQVEPVLLAIIHGIEARHPDMLCSILLLDDAGKHLIQGFAPSLPAFYNQAVEGLEIGLGVGSCGTAAYTGELVVVEDIATHPYWAPFKDLALQAGLRACWSQPIRSGSNKILGTFAIYHRTVSAPGEWELELIRQSSKLASIAIEKTRAEAKLRSSEERYRQLIESSPGGICVIAFGFIQYANPAMAKHVGYRQDELFQRPFIEWVVEDERETIQRLLDKPAAWIADDSHVSVELVAKDGGCKAFDVGIVQIDWNGSPALLSFFTDVTERKLAEAELRRSRSFVQSVLDSVESEIVVIDSTGHIMAVNEAWRRFSASNGAKSGPFSASAEIGVDYMTLCREIANDDQQALSKSAQAGIQDVLEGRLASFRLEYPFRALRQQRWFLMTVTPLGQNQQGAVIAHMDITERKQIEEKVRNLAYFDPLTHLPNRLMLQDRLAIAMADCKRWRLRGALMLLDLDQFKPLNDTYGHGVGDMLLIEVAKRLNGCVREVDTVVRLGGDEFIVVLTALDPDEQVAKAAALQIAEKIRRSLSAPYGLLARSGEGETESVIEYHCSASIGVTLFSGHYENHSDIIKRADVAMYEAKDSHRNAICFR